MARVRIGISGWRYAPWRAKFYPEGLPQKDELAYAARQFPSIEINGTFYSLQRPQSFAAWYDVTPDDFLFALKGPRYISHILRLKEAGGALANFFASGPLRLRHKLGPVLWQLPPNFQFDPDRLSAFFALLPRSTAAAAQLAARHNDKLKHRAWLKADSDRPLRHALEIRHDSFKSPDFIALLRRHNIGLVVADTVEWPLLVDATSDFVYVRLHGSQQLYASGYGPAALDVWAARIRAWIAGKEAQGSHTGPPAPALPRDVYVYFDNDAKVRAPFDARSLIAKLEKEPGETLSPTSRFQKGSKAQSEDRMAKSSLRQRRTEGRVMHEFKHGELKSGPGGKAGKVKSRKQAIAIALSEAGASKYNSKRENRRNRARSQSKEARGRTAQQEREGKSHIGAKGRRESTPVEGGQNARDRAKTCKRAAAARVRGGETKAELYQRARKRGIPDRSKMTKTQLENALKKS